MRKLNRKCIVLLLLTGRNRAPVSYTHLDVYKRQVLHFVAGDRRHAVLNNVLDIGHIGRRSDLRGGAAVLRGGFLLGAAAAGGQEHECRKYGA